MEAFSAAGQGTLAGDGSGRHAQGAAGPARRPGGPDGRPAEGGGAGDRGAEVEEPARRRRTHPGQGPRHGRGLGTSAHRADGVGGSDLRTLAPSCATGSSDRPAVVCSSAAPPDKPAVVVATTEGARHRGLQAGELVRSRREALGGRGGGKDDLAQGGGSASAPARTAGARPRSTSVIRTPGDQQQSGPTPWLRSDPARGWPWTGARRGSGSRPATRPARWPIPVATVPAGPAAYQDRPDLVARVRAASS